MSLQQIPLSPSYPWAGSGKLPRAVEIGNRESGAAGARTSPRNLASGAAHPDPASRENTLVQQAIRGDAEALERLFTVNTGRLRKIAFAVLRNKEDAEDALQNAFLSACRNLATFKGQSTFATWLTSIVINSARMARRKNNSRPESSLDEILDTSLGQTRREIAETRSNPEQACAETELNALIEHRIRRLPRRLQAAFRLHTLAELSLAESSAVLGVQPGTVKARIFRAQQNITRSMRLALRIRVPKSAAHFGNRYKGRVLTSRAGLANKPGESRTANLQESLEATT